MLRSGQVLVVDDEPSIRTMVALILSDEGIPATTVPDAAAADWLRGHRPHLILLDPSGDPASDGAFVAEARWLLGPNCPIVAFTARNGATAHTQRIGADGVLEKPFELDALLATVRRYVG